MRHKYAVSTGPKRDEKGFTNNIDLLKWLLHHDGSEEGQGQKGPIISTAEKAASNKKKSPYSPRSNILLPKIIPGGCKTSQTPPSSVLLIKKGGEEELFGDCAENYQKR